MARGAVAVNIAFYAPLKPPDHPVPSGDRQMARLLMQALGEAGFTVEVASSLRSYLHTPEDPRPLAAAAAERQRLLDAWRAGRPRPRLWFTYHPYYRAPDLIGPALASALAIPYVTAEASYAGKRDRDAWAASQAHVKHAVRSAALNLCFTEMDADGLGQIAGPEAIALLPPFIDAARIVTVPNPAPCGSVRLIAVAMMRGGVKLASYVMLANALGRIANEPWTLTVIGDGPERARVKAAFAGFPGGRIRWLGEVDPADVAAHLAAADIFVWPGTGEAYGMAYLEAQAAGLPVVAQATAGVPAVVRDGTSGLLTPSGDHVAFAAAVASLMSNHDLRRRLGAGARKFVTSERSLPAAAASLRRLLVPLVKESADHTDPHASTG